MPATRPRASFDPISPQFDLSALVEETPNFTYVDRISCDMIDQQGLDAFDKLVLLHVIIGGKPLVIDGYQSRLDPWTFSSKWLQDNIGDKVENARNITKNETLPLTVGHYLRNMSKLTDQYYEKPGNYKDKDRQRVYLKDIDCPDVWFDKLKEHLPPNLMYLNESTGDVGGPGAVDEAIPTGGKRKGRGIAPAGDLMSSLPPAMRAINLMCYIGHEGTYTPAHREMCGSLGHNIMVEASKLVGEDGKPEKPGSSIWFMTESKDRHSVAEYWLSILGHDIEVEHHFAQVAAWKRAPFTTYIVEQRPGDFILIPPLAPHQVWNRGTRTMKIAWNRTTSETLELAIKEALPNARMVCRDEQYKNKAIIYYTLQKYSSLLARAKDQEQTASSPQEAAAIRTNPKVRQLQKDFKKLFLMFKNIMLSEMFAPDSHEKNIQFNPFDSNITCAYCRGNIFNRFLTCSSCQDALGTTEPEPYDVCMECYAMGRSCGCISKLKWAEQFKWKELAMKYEQWRRQYLELERQPKPDSPLPLAEERQRFESKTLAQVCQEQLKRRPWVDMNKSHKEDEDEEVEIEVNEDGTVKKTKKRRSEAWLKNRHACHVCQHRHEKWKMAECKCGRWWCYGSLFRAHDLMPADVMADANWRCPHCIGICGAGSCRKDPRQNPYQPKGTLLGHDTRKVADARSVESLVDFSVSNLSWLGENREAPVDNARLIERQQEAEKAKAALQIAHDPLASDVEGEDDQIEYDSVIDPALNPTSIDPSLLGPPGQQLQHLTASTLDDTNHLNGSASPGEHPGYQPAMHAAAVHTGFVAPSAVMLRPLPGADDTYPDLDAPEFEQPSFSRKRKADDDSIKRLPAKKRARPEEEVEVSGATKQYRKEQERKALEEARKKGRFIQVHAALKGKSKLVKLPVPRNVLAQLQAHPSTRDRSPEIAPRAEEEGQGEVDLLRSDLAAPPQPRAAAASTTDKQSKQVRVRVEHDEDFSTRRRPRRERKLTTTGKDAKKGKEYEELELESDVDNNVTMKGGGGGGDDEEGSGKTRSRRRRISAWQAARQEPEEGSRGDGDDDEEEDEEEDQDEPQLQTTKRVSQLQPRGSTRASHSIADTAAAALRQEQDNRLAKLAAAGLSNGSEQHEYDDAAEVGVKAVALSGSILNRTGPGGRRVKIMSAANRRQTTGAIGNGVSSGVSGGVGFKSSPMTKS